MQQAEIDEGRPVLVGNEAHWLRAEVMRRLGRDRTTLWRWAKAGKITQRSYLGRACYPVGEVLSIEAAEKKKENGHG
jgi:predicted site-specific integrase-resolvase